MAVNVLSRSALRTQTQILCVCAAHAMCAAILHAACGDAASEQCSYCAYVVPNPDCLISLGKVAGS